LTLHVAATEEEAEVRCMSRWIVYAYFLLFPFFSLFVHHLTFNVILSLVLLLKEALDRFEDEIEEEKEDLEEKAEEEVAIGIAEREQHRWALPKREHKHHHHVSHHHTHHHSPRSEVLLEMQYEDEDEVINRSIELAHNGNFVATSQ
jgi:biopolymer transport protein ExbB/TolQ